MLLALAVLAYLAALSFANERPLPGTEPLVFDRDPAAEMVAGISRFADAAIADAAARRSRRSRRGSSPAQYRKSVAALRKRFRKIIGLVDDREPPAMQILADAADPSATTVGEGDGYSIHAVRWPAVRNVEGEGLLLTPKGRPVADVVALPDCDSTPEMLVGQAPGLPAREQFARRLAECGCRVLVPALIDRQDTHSGIPGANMTNQPHREFIYRAAFELGRHIIGYEVQKVLAGVAWLRASQGRTGRSVGVSGCGEGGRLARYAAAAEEAVDAAAVCGYFQPRDRVWAEPIYRNVFGLLESFGDAEIASLVAPRALIVEACRHPRVDGPPQPSQGRSGAAPGRLATPAFDAVEAEFHRAEALVAGLRPKPSFCLVGDGRGDPGSDAALAALLAGLGTKRKLAPSSRRPRRGKQRTDLAARLERQFRQLADDTQWALREAEFRREAFWASADDSSAAAWEKSCTWYRDYLWDEVIGRLPEATLPPRPRTRLLYDDPKFRGYEVMLDVYPDVFAYGILLVPKRMRRGERRPVVVCQHGLEGTSQRTTEPESDGVPYERFAAKLAARGFVTYSPQNPYIGGDAFRVLQRKLNPIKKSLFSVIVRQHQVTLRWLASLPFVDGQRMGFYGISYGGKTAMRVPALLPEYCLSICSADFDEWIWKNASTRHRYSYLRTGEYEMPEFDLGNTFNYAELSWLILPRPFMVERGHHDGVAPDEWVAYEYAKTFRRYDLLGLGDRTELEVFDGPHAIHGVGTFDFLHRHLRWPPRRG